MRTQAARTDRTVRQCPLCWAPTCQLGPRPQPRPPWACLRGIAGCDGLLPGLLHLGCDPLAHHLCAEEGAPGRGEAAGPACAGRRLSDGSCRPRGARPPHLCRDRGVTGAPGSCGDSSHLLKPCPAEWVHHLCPGAPGSQGWCHGLGVRPQAPCQSSAPQRDDIWGRSGSGEVPGGLGVLTVSTALSSPSGDTEGRRPCANQEVGSPRDPNALVP